MYYGCKECSAHLNLKSEHLYPPDLYFEAGNKKSLSFSWIDPDKFKLEKEDKIRPFFETLNYWGIQRKRTKIKCINCGHLLGYIYDDGPPLTDSTGQFHFGPSQVIPRHPRHVYSAQEAVCSAKELGFPAFLLEGNSETVVLQPDSYEAVQGVASIVIQTVCDELGACKDANKPTRIAREGNSMADRIAKWAMIQPMV